MDMENLNIDDILVQFLDKRELTEEEKQFLREWLAMPENRKRYKEWQRMEAALYACGKAKEIDTRKAWLKLRKVITRQRRVRVLLSYVAAASAVLLVGWGLFVMFSRVQHAPVEMVANGNLQDEGQIVLTLSDGRQVVLSDSLGTLQEQNGTRIANKDHSLVYDAADHSVEVAYNTVSIPWGAEYKLVLADGSKVWLNAQSSVTYPVAFHGKTREIRLEGEAYFEVAPNKTQPFIVHTAHFDVQVTGTQFNVRAYGGETESATLAEGGIQLKKDGQTYTLQPGQQAYMKQEQEQVRVREVDLKSAIAWRYNAFSFEETPLEEIMNELSRWYNIHVFYLNPKVKELHFTAWFRRNSTLEEVIEILQKTGKVKIELKEKTITVTQ